MLWPFATSCRSCCRCSSFAQRAQPVPVGLRMRHVRHVRCMSYPGRPGSTLRTGWPNTPVMPMATVTTSSALTCVHTAVRLRALFLRPRRQSSSDRGRRKLTARRRSLSVRLRWLRLLRTSHGVRDHQNGDCASSHLSVAATSSTNSPSQCRCNGGAKRDSGWSSCFERASDGHRTSFRTFACCVRPHNQPCGLRGYPA